MAANCSGRGREKGRGFRQLDSLFFCYISTFTEEKLNHKSASYLSKCNYLSTNRNKSYEEKRRRDSFGTRERRMNCFIRRIAAAEEEKAAAR